MARHMAEPSQNRGDTEQGAEPRHIDTSRQAAESSAVPAETPVPAAPAEAPMPVKQVELPRDRTRKNALSNLLIAVGVVLLLVAGGIYAYNWWNYHKIDEGNERLAEYAKLTDGQDGPPEVDWNALKALNPDVVGWLQVPGTIVNYPVYQSGDNDYYLNHAADGSSSIGGAVFMDYENKAPGMVDEQTIIYGHHMRNGSQFKPIADMDNQELFDDVSTVWYVTEQGPYELAPLFVFYTTAEDTEVRQFDFASEEEFHSYLMRYLGEAVTKRADAAEAIASAKHVLTLSTCNYYDGYGRTLLVCVPKAELPGAEQPSEAEQTSDAETSEAETPEAETPEAE